jgi:uncharacterized protein (DUF433 family)
VAIGLEYPHIDKPEGLPARLSKHPRIRVAQLAMDYLAHGWSAEEMCHQHEYLSLSEAHAALLYYWDHQEEIDSEIQAEFLNYESERRHSLPSALAVRLRVRTKAGS